MAKPIGKNPTPSVIRKDPAGFRPTEKENARLLLNLVSDFAELTTRELARRQLAVPANQGAQITFVLKTVKQVETLIDGRPATLAAQKMAQASVDKGQDWADKAMNAKGVPVPEGKKLFYSPVDKRMVDAMAERNLSEIKNLTGDMATRLARTLATGISNAERMQQLIKRVREVTQFSKNRAITIARTETLRAANTAAKSRYEQYGVDKVEFVSARDDRTCEECEGLHGNRYDLDDAPDLPIHPNCRCTLIPYIRRD